MSEAHVLPAERVQVRDARIKLVAFDDITLGSRVRYLVKNVIPRVGLVIVWGPPKSGKSFWMFDTAMHIALGWPYRGRRVQQGCVVYCAFEGQSGIEARVQAFRQRFLADDAEPVPFYLQPATLDLVADHEALIAVIRRNGAQPSLVVLDTLNRSLRGSESSDEDMSAYVRAADAIREAFDCAVAVVHHCGIDGTRPRGHTALTGAADAQIAVKRDAADNITVTVELAKDGPQGDVIMSRLEVIDVGLDDDGEVITSCVVIASDDAAPVGRSGKKRSPASQKVMAAFGRLYEAGSTVPAPNVPGVVAGTRAVTLADLRDASFKLGVFSQPEPPESAEAKERTKWRNSRNTAFARGLDPLTEMGGPLRLEDGFVWEPRRQAER